MNIRAGSIEVAAPVVADELSPLDLREKRAIARKFLGLSRTERLDAVCYVLGRGYPVLYRELNDELSPTVDAGLDLSSIITLLA